MSQGKRLGNSFRELKNVYSLTAVAMLLALRVVLGIFANGTLAFFGNNVKITFAFVPISVAGAMFGPFSAALVGGLGDIISFLLQPAPGGYFPGFTISGIITGIIYGCVFYKNKVTLPRVIIAWIINMLLVETFLAAFWLHSLYGSTYSFYLITRFISVGVKCIPEILLIFATGKICDRIKFPSKINKK